MNRTALFFVPHPDDETLTGLLPLRLHQEAGWRMEVIPFSLGSDPARRAARKRELQAACRVLGFKVSFPPVTAADIGALVKQKQPGLIFLPHAQDMHPRHQATHRLGLAIVDACARDQLLVETEFWHPNLHPNLCVSASARQIATLKTALACHVGEMARADYLRSFPAWLQDNARRGAERVGGFGSHAPPFRHAVLYRLRHRRNGKWQPLLRSGMILNTLQDLARWEEICQLAIRQVTG